MSRNVYICPICAGKYHKVESVPFEYGFGIEKTLIDGKEAEQVMFPPSRLRKCIDCGKKTRYAWRIRK
jgi:hypothetical protein